MGFFGDVATSLLVMKVDTTDMRAKLRQLKGDEKEVVKAQIESAEARNRSIEGYGKALVKVNTVLATMTKAVQFGAESFKAFEEHTKLSAATSKYSLDSLRKASAGLKTDLDLMRLAQKAAGAQTAVSESQLIAATKAMRAFEAAGFDGAKVQDKVGEALLKGSIEPLKDLGVNLEAAKGKTGQMSQLMEVLGKKSREAGSGINSQTDEFKRAGVEYQNSMQKLKVAIGEIVVALTPLIAALAKVVGLVADVVSAAGDDSQTDPTNGYILNRDLREKTGMGKVGKDTRGFYIWSDLAKQLDGQQQAGSAGVDALLSYTNALATGAGRQAPKPRGSGGGGKKKDQPLYFITNERTGEIIPVYAPFATGAATGQDFGFQQGNVAAWGAGSAGPSGDMLASASAGMGADSAAELSKMLAGLNQFVAGGILAEDQSFLTSIFGPIDEFDAYASAFDVLSGTLQAGFDAWVSGSGSASEAMKEFFKTAISGVASQMFAQAISHGAHAIGSLAFGLAGGPAGAGHMAAAAMHAKAAAGFAAGAAIVGGIARATGGGDAATGASAGAGARAPSVTGGGAAAGGGNQAITVIVGDIWAADNQRKKNRDVARAVRSAERELQGSRGVTRR